MAGKTRAEIPQELLTGPLKRQTVKKNVAAIHVSGKLTLLQRKLSNVLLLNAYDDLETKTKHRIDARTLTLMIGYNSNDIETLKDALRGLAETLVEWDILSEKGEPDWGVSALLASAQLKDGVCEYSYSTVLAEKMSDPEVFAHINVNIQRRFSSGYGLALYENCYRFVRTGSTGWWSLDLFRQLMGVDGSAYYQSFKQLNAKIIKPAVAEVNRNSNIIIAPEFRKKGRAVSEIRFSIRENPQLAMFDIDDGEGVRSSDTYRKLRALGVSDRLARQWISGHGEAYVAEKIAYVQASKSVKNPAGYLSAAMRDDYKASEGQGGRAAARPVHDPEATAAAAARRRKQAETDQADESAREAEIARLRRTLAERIVRVEAAVRARGPAQEEADRKRFLESLSSELERQDFARNGWASRVNADAIATFWEGQVPGIFDDLADESGG